MPVLRVKGLCYQQYGPYSFTIEPSQCVSLSGPSGAGKSLMLRAIVDLDVHQGEIYLDDVNCSQMPATRWRRLIGLLPATSQWWFDTVGSHFHSIDNTLLQKTGFESDVMHWQVSRLSQGESQRLGLVRMICNKPRALLLDEPTASLDSNNVELMEALITEYSHEHAAPVLWVSHDRQQTRRISKRYFILDTQGRLTEE